MTKFKLLKVRELSEELLDIGGDFKNQIKRLRDLTYVYSKPFSVENVAINFWCDDDRVLVKNKKLIIDQVVFEPKTLSDFVSICLSLGIQIYWDEEVFTLNIDNRSIIITKN